jgi:tetratricopeptide (TPR) repeat protein
VRLFLALTLGVGIPLALAATAWSAEGYGEQDLKALETIDEAKLRKLREEEVTELRITLGRRLGPDRRADLYLRLAEIYIEAYRQDYILEGRVHDKRLEAGAHEEFINHGHSNRFLNEGMTAAKNILELNIAYSKMDEVFWFLGFYSSELGKSKESLAYFKQLINKYPNSPFVSEAYREEGDAEFDKRDYRNALANYEHAVKHADPDTKPRILHKLAWCYYRTRQYDRAVETMKQAIAATNKNNEKFISLREEALRDMAIFMTETGRASEALSYFQSVAGDKDFYPKILEKLGRQYERNVEPDKAEVVYESLLKTHPDSDSAFRVRIKLVDLALKRGHYKEALAQLKSVQIPTNNDNDTVAAVATLKVTVRKTATDHHEAYRKHQEKADLEIAETFYQAYIDYFLAKQDPKSELPEIEMYLAEVKRDQGKSEEASALYRKVLDSKDKRYMKEAGELWTASLADSIHKAAGKDHGAPKGTEPSSLEKEFVDAADHMVGAYGDSAEGREASLRAAQVQAGYKSTQGDAINRIKKILIDYPKSPQALTAAKLWIQITADQAGTATPSPAPVPTSASDQEPALSGIQEAMQEIRVNKPLMDNDLANGGKLRMLISDQETRTKAATITAQEKNKDYEGAAKGYEEFAKQATLQEISERSYANALLNYSRAADAEAVERVLTEWLRRFPDSAKAPEAIRGNATQLLVDGHFDSAARLFERLGRTGKDSAALLTAARLYEGNGDLPHAQQIWNHWLEIYRNKDSLKESGEAWDVLLTLAQSYEQTAQPNDAAKAYKRCMAGSPELDAECGARLADLYFKNADDENAKAALKKVAAQSDTKRKNGDLSPYVAYARFKLASFMEASAHFEPLRLPEATLKKAMNQRLEFLEPLSRAYSGALSAGGPWGIAALDRLALWAWNFADDIDKIPPPNGIQGAALEQFQKNLKSISDPLRKKALNTWSDAYAKAAQMEALSPVLPSVVDRLADEGARTPFRAQGPRGRFRLAGLPADGGADGRAGALQKTRDRLTKNVQDAAAWVDYGNLLWGTGKPLLAKVAYEYALKLNPKNPAALNNRGVIAANGDNEEDWARAAEARQLFREALRADEFFLPAKLNYAALLNYYRVFGKAKSLWTQVRLKAQNADVEDGAAIALQGMGDLAAADEAFNKAASLGGAPGRFAAAYNAAARSAAQTKDGGADCLAKLGGLNEINLNGFEKDAVIHLRGICSIGSSNASTGAGGGKGAQ